MRPERTFSSKASRVTKWYATPSRSSPRGARVVCDTEKRRPPSSRRTRATTVDLPAPEGAEITNTLVRRSLNVLHLLPEPLDGGLEPQRFVHHRRRDGLAAQRVGLAHQLLRQEVEALAARGGPRDRLAHQVHVAAQARE